MANTNGNDDGDAHDENCYLVWVGDERKDQW